MSTGHTVHEASERDPSKCPCVMAEATAYWLACGDPVWCRASCAPADNGSEERNPRAVEIVTQTMLRIDYTNLGLAEQDDAAEPGA